jgi:hypothetical protein
LLDHVVQGNDAILVGRGRREELEEVVAALRGDLGGCAGRQLGEVDVVDEDLDVVRLPPSLRVDVVEPRVVLRNEVAPLDDAQRAA